MRHLGLKNVAAIGAASAVLAIAVACGDATSPSTSTTGAATAKPQAINALATGERFSCMLTDTGQAYCWGADSVGQLGTGDTVSSTTPRATTGGLQFNQITIGTDFACALTPAGGAYCWGEGIYGQLGNGSQANSFAPVPVANGVKFSTISAGFRFACGIESTTNNAYCWGDNSSGSLGTGDATTRTTPTKVIGGLQFKTLHTGLSDACGTVVSPPDSIFCWGWNNAGLITPTPILVLAPRAIAYAFPSTPIGVITGAERSCATFATGPAYCWGQNRYGEMGYGSTAPRVVTVPQAMVAGISFAGITQSRENDTNDGACGWTSDGTGYCWGIDTNGQLGANPPLTCAALGGTYPCTGTPQLVGGGYSFIAMSSGAEHTCGITSAHAVVCWGWNKYGQLGNGTLDNASAPTPVAGGLRTP